MFKPNFHHEHLPDINVGVECARLCFGSLIRLAIVHGGRYAYNYFSCKKLKKNDEQELHKSERIQLCEALSTGVEIGASVLVMPARYLIAINTPRFLFDYMFNGLSDKFSYIDHFLPGKFASLATYAFMNMTDSWNLDFFKWQMPSVLLSLGKLFYRRRYNGAEKCKTKRVLAAIALQLLLRAYTATFSIMLPENGEELITALVTVLLETLTTQYIISETWVYPLEEIATASTSDNSVKTGGADKKS